MYILKINIIVIYYITLLYINYLSIRVGNILLFKLFYIIPITQNRNNGSVIITEFINFDKKTETSQ